MSISYFLFANNPFFDAFVHTDFLGRLIFIGLVSCSVITWTLMIHKIRLSQKVQSLSKQFQKVFSEQKLHPLNVTYHHTILKEFPHPYWDLYQVLKKNTLELLSKNQAFQNVNDPNSPSFLSPADIDVIESHLASTISSQTMRLEKNLYILSTITSLAPFLGLLGTVWGILTTFAELQVQGAGNTNQAVLGGLSLALATTVMGLLNAIPAQVGYNYLKNGFNDYQRQMENFSTEILSTVELHYRKVELD